MSDTPILDKITWGSPTRVYNWIKVELGGHIMEIAPTDPIYNEFSQSAGVPITISSRVFDGTTYHVSTNVARSIYFVWVWIGNTQAYWIRPVELAKVVDATTMAKVLLKEF